MMEESDMQAKNARAFQINLLPSRDATPCPMPLGRGRGGVGTRKRIFIRGRRLVGLPTEIKQVPNGLEELAQDVPLAGHSRVRRVVHAQEPRSPGDGVAEQDEFVIKDVAVRAGFPGARLVAHVRHEDDAPGPAPGAFVAGEGDPSPGFVGAARVQYSGPQVENPPQVGRIALPGQTRIVGAQVGENELLGFLGRGRPLGLRVPHGCQRGLIQDGEVVLRVNENPGQDLQ